jgi:hypothetical protein
MVPARDLLIMRLYTPKADIRGHGWHVRQEPEADICDAAIDVCFSNRPVWVKRFQTIHQLQCRCRSRARASLRNRH